MAGYAKRRDNTHHTYGSVCCVPPPGLTLPDPPGLSPQEPPGLTPPGLELAPPPGLSLEQETGVTEQGHSTVDGLDKSHEPSESSRPVHTIGEPWVVQDAKSGDVSKSQTSPEEAQDKQKSTDGQTRRMELHANIKGRHLPNLTGQIRMYDPTHGWGFVVSPDFPGDLFLHWRHIIEVPPTSPGSHAQAVSIGQSVIFDLDLQNPRPQCLNVRVMNIDAASGDMEDCSAWHEWTDWPQTTAYDLYSTTLTPKQRTNFDVDAASPWDKKEVLRDENGNFMWNPTKIIEFVPSGVAGKQSETPYQSSYDASGEQPEAVSSKLNPNAEAFVPTSFQ